jgi:(4-(4-[2-(gamma-L-glutamylamino)ethyl]phenoxymethyl)furan-2-yl)methanamine synthase
MKDPIIGWDVGGANIKAALVERAAGAGSIVVEQPFALWRDPHRLPEVLIETAHRLGGVRTMAATMTAELADCFATKREGVRFVLDALSHAFPGVDVQIYGLDGTFRSLEAARERPHRVAAANWMASATLAAQTFPDALFIDVGSTTTDIIPLAGGRVVARGRTDPARMRSGELVYTGALRTPICAIVRTVPLRGRRCRVAAEHFAVAADAHLWLGQIAERAYTCETPDGRGRSREEAGARLARMVCADLEMLTPDDITAIAAAVARAQVRQIAGGIRQVMRGSRARWPGTAVVVGHGAFLARAAAPDVGLTVREPRGCAFDTPASAVACLLFDRTANVFARPEPVGGRASQGSWFDKLTTSDT